MQGTTTLKLQNLLAYGNALQAKTTSTKSYDVCKFWYCLYRPDSITLQ